MAARYVVLGGGVSGLSAAYFLARELAQKNLPTAITLIEKGKLGGWMQTHSNGHALFELGPRSIRATGFAGHHTLKLVQDIGLEDKVLEVTPEDPAAANRFLYVNKKLHRLPNSITDLFKKKPPLSSPIASIYLKGMFLKEVPQGAETMYDVISSKFGEEVAKYHLDAFVRGVFAADAKELSLKAAFPPIWQKFRPRKATLQRKPQLNEPQLAYAMLRDSIIKKSKKNKWMMWNMEGGLSQLVDGLAKACGEYGVKIVKGNVTGLELQQNGKFSVKADLEETENEDGQVLKNSLVDADVISALPSHDLSRILSNQSAKSGHEELFLKAGNMLEEIKSVDVGVVNLEFRGRPEDILPDIGFGHLIPSCEDSKVLGIVYDSCVFREHDRTDFPTTRLTCMMGGSWFELLFGDPERVKVRDLEKAALESVAEQLGITDDPTAVVSRLCRNCIPTYRVGHTDLVESIENLFFENNIALTICGSSFWGVSVNDCIYNGRAAANETLMKAEKAAK